jgi:replicative DNA helicase
LQNQQTNKLTKYGHQFQTKALALLITDKEFLQQVSDIVYPEYFDSDANKWIAEQTIKYYEEYRTTPTMEVFKVELDKIKNEIISVAVKEQLKETYKATKAKDLKFVGDEYLDFCKNQTLKGALIKSVDLLEMGGYDDIRTLIGNALKAGVEKSLGHEYIKELEDRYREDSRSVVETPWDNINRLLGGGLGKGDLGLIVGGPGTGKSWALVAIGAHAVSLGCKVLHYTLELDDIYVGRRYDATFTEIPVDDIVEHKDVVEEKLKSLRGELYLKNYPTNGAGINTLHAHIEKCKGQDINPDLIIVDYADLLKGSGKERRDRLDDIYLNLRGLAGEVKLPIWTASQVNRTGAREEIIQGDRIAESYAKMMISDFAMSLSRTNNDKENGTGRWHIMKNRYGPDGMTFNSTIDLSIGKIEILDETTSNSENGVRTPMGGLTFEERRRAFSAHENFIRTG